MNTDRKVCQCLNTDVFGGAVGGVIVGHRLDHSGAMIVDIACNECGGVCSINAAPMEKLLRDVDRQIAGGVDHE